MQPSLLILADYATVDQSGKLVAAGIFHQINAHKFPFVHLNMFLLLEFSVSRSEADRKFKLTVHLMDEDGRTILEVTADAQTPPSQTGKWLRTYLGTVFQFANVAFEKPGTYQFSVLIDGDEKATLPLEVMEIQPTPSQD